LIGTAVADFQTENAGMQTFIFIVPQTHPFAARIVTNG